MEIYKIIKSRRLELGLTLKDVAKRLGVAESTVSRYESSEIANMGIDKIEALAKALQCTPGYLMGWEEKEVDTDAVARLLHRFPEIFKDKFIETYACMPEETKKQIRDYADFLVRRN